MSDKLVIALVVLVVVLLSFVLIAIRQVRILDRELKEARQELLKQSIKPQTKN